MMNHRPANLRPSIRQLLVHHDHIHRPADPPDSVPQANGLGDTVLDLPLDDQEVQIAVARKLTARSRPKQDYPGWRSGSVHKPLSSQLDQLLRSHDKDSLPADHLNELFNVSCDTRNGLPDKIKQAV
jgi:hypothetical protein